MALTHALTYAGGLPFVAAAILALLGESVPLLEISPVELAQSYGLIISAFMAGCLWGYQQRTTEPMITEPMGLIGSNVVALGAWLSALTVTAVTSLFVLSGLFVGLLALDWAAYRRRLISRSYVLLRTRITLVVVVALIVTAYAS